MSIRKLSVEEIESLKQDINHGGRKSKYDMEFRTLHVGDWVEVQNVNRGVISRTAKRLGMKLSVHAINGKYYVERTE